MKCCDKTYYDLGNYSSCGNIATGLLSDAAGVHRIIFDFKGVQHGFDILIENQGDEFIIPNIFNEYGSTIFKIKKPNGTYYEFNKYNCIWLICEKFTNFSLTLIPFNLITLATDDRPTVSGCSI